MDEQGGAVRKRARRDGFAEREEALINRLVDGRLLVTNRDDANLSWVEVAHEAVLRHWQRFCDWLEANRRFLLWRNRLKAIRDSQSLLRAEALAEALGWMKEHVQDLDAEERQFIEKSRWAVRNRRLGGQMAAALALVLTAGAASWWYQEDQRKRPIIREEDWVPIPAGTFQMGSLDTDDEALGWERPPHEVHITKPFALGRYEVTFKEYDRFAYATNRRPPSDAGFGTGFSEAERKRLPVINVSWEDARAYAAWLSEKTGEQFRLPTEAEWEYAARAGTTTRRFWGDAAEDACQHANVHDRKHKAELKQRYAIDWEPHACDDEYATLAPIGRLKSNQPNRWGLHDMLGNVFEWVEDCWHENYDAAPKDGSPWEEPNGGDCALRVVRGGSWYNGPGDVRSANRLWITPDYRDSYVGFRLAQDN